MPCVGIFVKHTVCSLHWNQNKFWKLEQTEDNSYNRSMGQGRFNYELKFWFFLIENGGKQIVKIHLQ